MKILIVTQYLDNFSGSELFVLNISKELTDNGHDVSIFSPVLGKIAEKARGMGISVTDNLLDYKNEKFDIIHAQHNPTAILARSVFPKTPMVFMSHGFLPELEQPPSIDLGIEKFIVLSEETKEHLVKNHLIPEAKITFLNNSIDTEKFYPKRKPTKRPRKILVISNHYTEEVKKVIEGAATDLNMEVVHAGMPDNPVPSEAMPDYINQSDIVVTLGLGALEAMACARNVIIYDIHGADGMVDEKNFFEIRKNNFSGRRYKYKYSKDSFKKELLKYKPMIGEQLRKIVLEEHAFKKMAEDLLKLYSTFKDSKVETNFKRLTLYNEIEFLERFSPTNAAIREEIAQEIEVDGKNKLISEYEKIMKTQEDIIGQKDQEITAMQNSKFWKLRSVYVRFGPRRFRNVYRRALGALKRDGLSMFLRKVWYFIYFNKKIPQQYPEYQKWIKNNEKVTAREAKTEIAKFKHNPKISIIVPVYNVEPRWLDMAINAVSSQYYENWELCMHDDASTNKETIECLKAWQRKNDPRIKISFGEKNQHISGASNDALKMATGEFIVFLDNEDELSLNALYENVSLINKHPEMDFIYSDEDKINQRGKRVDPYFKPDWSPDLLLSQMYTSHLSFYRKKIIDKIGGFRKGFEGAQDHDLVLRFIEHTDASKIGHIPKVLYHWRQVETSTASASSAKGYTHLAGKRAIEDYLKRNKIKGKVIDGTPFGFYRVVYEIEDNPLVSIIIPFRDQAEVLKTCVDSIIEKTDYDNYEIILVDNQSKEKKTIDYMRAIGTKQRVRVLNYNRPFNYSAINNYAVERATGEYVVLLNNDMEVITGEWLRAMLEHAQRRGVGAVGAKLLYPNNTIQHVGVVMGLGIAGHAFKRLPDGLPCKFSHAEIIKNYSVVTAACLMVKKSIYKEVGGLNEKDLKVAYNDVDFCLRVLEAGYRNVYTPYAKLYHYESFSRGDDEGLKETNPKEYKRVLAEREYMEKKWDKYIKNDPYYSPNLTRKHENFSIRTK